MIIDLIDYSLKHGNIMQVVINYLKQGLNEYSDFVIHNLMYFCIDYYQISVCIVKDKYIKSFRLMSENIFLFKKENNIYYPAYFTKVSRIFWIPIQYIEKLVPEINKKSSDLINLLKELKKIKCYLNNQGDVFAIQGEYKNEDLFIPLEVAKPKFLF